MRIRESEWEEEAAPSPRPLPRGEGAPPAQRLVESLCWD